MRNPRVIALVLLAIAAAPAAAVRVTCDDATRIAYVDIPRFFYADRPDSLYGTLLAWQSECGSTEVIERTRILAAIWDDAFDESVYDDSIIDDLANHVRVLRAEPDPQSDDPRERYDAFTISLADQLLPHTDRGSLEEFFCLFYSGRTAEAWTLLESEQLADTDLASMRDVELEVLRAPRTDMFLAATSGGWWPSGDVGFVGEKPLLGLLLGWRSDDWLARFVMEFRVGRSARPYYVDYDGVTGYSDRFDAGLIGIELGRILARQGRWAVDLFGGAAGDYIMPFGGEDITLGAFNGSVGAGVRWQVHPHHGWLVGLDVRREWIADRNTAGTPLGGQAWSLRVVLGLLKDDGQGAKLRALAP